MRLSGQTSRISPESSKPDGTGPEDQHPVGPGELIVRGVQVVHGLRRAGGHVPGVRRIGVARPRGQDEVVSVDTAAAGQGHTGGVSRRYGVADDSAMLEEGPVVEEGIVGPVRSRQCPQRTREVDKRIPWIDEGDVRIAVDGLGDQCPA